MKRTMTIALAVALLRLPMVARADDGRGTWVITPSAVGGNEPVHFVGNTAPNVDRRSNVASAPPTRYAPSNQTAPSTQK